MTECDSKELLIAREGKGIHFQSLKISRPVPPPLPADGVCGNMSNEQCSLLLFIFTGYFA